MQAQKAIQQMLQPDAAPEATNMGASIENAHLQAAALEALRQSGKVEILKQKVSSVQAGTVSARPVVTLENGDVLEPTLLVGSDGEKSLTRTEYKIGTWGHSYGQKGLVCTVKTMQPSVTAF